MASLTYGGRCWRSLPHVPADVRRALVPTLRDLEASAALPGVDVFDIIPPAQHAWRRRIGASAWWVYYELRPDGSAVLCAVAIPVE